MTDINEWYICKKCGESFKRWQGSSCWNPGKCIKCATLKSKKLNGHINMKACKLCDKKFDAGFGLDSGRKYCDDCRYLSQYERKILLAEKGLGKMPKRGSKPKKDVDNRIFVSVHSFMHTPVEKMLKKIADERVVLIA